MQAKCCTTKAKWPTIIGFCNEDNSDDKLTKDLNQAIWSGVVQATTECLWPTFLFIAEGPRDIEYMSAMYGIKPDDVPCIGIWSQGRLHTTGTMDTFKKLIYPFSGTGVCYWLHEMMTLVAYRDEKAYQLNKLYCDLKEGSDIDGRSRVQTAVRTPAPGGYEAGVIPVGYP